MPVALSWSKGREAQFTLDLTTDLQRAISDRSSLDTKWKGWLDDYRAPISTELKLFPWEGASNDTLPVAAMNTDPLLARFMTTLHAPANLWTLQPMNERWVNVAKPLQDYLQFVDSTQLRMYDVNYRALLEFVKLGTCI